MFSDRKIWIGQSDNKENIYLYPSMANRHGLIAGATGIGKTITMNITVIGDSDAVSKALADIEQIKSIETKEDAGSVTAKVEIDAGDSTENEIRAALAKALATAGLPVMSISAQSHSLEEVFLELTTADAGAVPEEAVPTDDEKGGDEIMPADAEEETDLPSDEENGEVMS